ncbi:MAG: helix-turn-helix transcriptional regulator [Betaproteobacteria bacterium]|nr:helix-turn-helix transcriptional regulator [Betaproteobacteria bacterium]
MSNSSQSDRLSILFDHFEVKTKVFAFGTLCGESVFDIQPGLGHIHIIKKPSIEIILKNNKLIVVDEPSLVFFPKPVYHRFRSIFDYGSDMICSTISFVSGMQNPLTNGLPEILILPLRKLLGFEKIFELLYLEAFENTCGKQYAINHLMDYLTLRIYRFLIKENLIESSPMAGIADPKITKAFSAVHKSPAFNWTVDSLAQEAGMSRARFSEYFKQKVGMTPISYLTDLRINIAIKYIIKGKSVKSIHKEVGYSSASSFTRVFLQRTGMTPKEWLKNKIMTQQEK